MEGGTDESPHARPPPEVVTRAGAFAMNGAPSDGAAGTGGTAGGGHGSGHDGVDQGVKHARTVSVLAIAEIAGKVASFVMFAVAARLLGPAEFGQFTWSFNLALLLSAFVIWGFDFTLIQVASKHRDRLDAMLSDLLAIRALLTPLALLVVWVFPAGSSENTEVSLVMTLAVLADSSNQAIRSAAAVIDRQREVALNLVAQRLATAAIAVAVLFAGGGVRGMSWAYLVGTLIGAALMYWTAHRIGLSPSPRLVTRAGMRELLTSSTALGISTTLNMLAFRVDTLLLGWLMTSSAVGVYSAAYKLFETVLFVIWSVDRVALPTMAATEGDEPIRRGVHRACSAVWALYVPYILVMVVQGESILNLVYGTPYGTDSLAALQWLVVSLVPYSLQYLLASGLVARLRNRMVTWAAFAALVLNVVANLILIPRYGPAGAGMATFIAMAGQSVVLYLALRREVGSPGLLRSGLVPGIAGAVMVLPLLLPWLIPAVVVAGCVYAAVWMLAATKLDPVAARTVQGMVGLKRA